LEELQLALVQHLRDCFFTEALGMRVCHMLGLARSPALPGQDLPQGWHFALIDCETPRALLRPDGFPGLGVPLPAIALPRLVAGGRSVTFRRPLAVGSRLIRSSTITDVLRKEGPAGPLAIVKVCHTFGEEGSGSELPAKAAIHEEQTFILLQSPYDAMATRRQAVPASAQPILTFTPDQTLLFQFSALSFNSHKIHLDRKFAQEVEGYPDLVVNGGLTTLLMTEIARCELGLRIKALSVRNTAPLFCDRVITFLVEPGAGFTRILAADDQGSIAAEMDIDHDEP
jgi:3-methylfumaryl-CoA hydratase